MSEWVDVTSSFSDKRRRYRDTWLEICEVLDDTIECSLFSRPDGPYEIYVNFGLMYGVSCASPDKAAAQRERMKADIEAEHRKHGDPTPEFVNAFVPKYDLRIENALFDSDDLDRLLGMFE